MVLVYFNWCKKVVEIVIVSYDSMVNWCQLIKLTMIMVISLVIYLSYILKCLMDISNGLWLSVGIDSGIRYSYGPHKLLE